MNACILLFVYLKKDNFENTTILCY